MKENKVSLKFTDLSTKIHHLGKGIIIKLNKIMLCAVILLIITGNDKNIPESIEDVAYVQVSSENNAPYTQRREKENLHITVSESENQLKVSIPEKADSEKKLNQWLAEYYAGEEKENQDFLGYNVEENNGIFKTALERAEEGWYRNSSLKAVRADDAVISFLEETYTYMGGNRGFDISAGYSFNSRSGERLTLAEAVKNEDVFYDFAVQFLEKMYEEYDWKKEEDSWFFSEQGIELIVNPYYNSRSLFYCIPYEYAADYLKEDYLPVKRQATVHCYNSVSYMDVNGDFIPDVFEYSGDTDEGTLEISINGKVSCLTFNTVETALSNTDNRIDRYEIVILREENGCCDMEVTLYKYDSASNDYITAAYIYQIDGDKPVFKETGAAAFNFSFPYDTWYRVV